MTLQTDFRAIEIDDLEAMLDEALHAELSEVVWRIVDEIDRREGRVEIVI